MTTDLARKACIFCNGELKNSARIKRVASNCDLLIAADGGAEHLVGLGLQPRIIIGNMDSLTVDRWNNENYTVRIPHSPDKDKSDAELAVEYALEQGCEQVILADKNKKQLSLEQENTNSLKSKISNFFKYRFERKKQIFSR